jgi:hypothetical protein
MDMPKLDRRAFAAVALFFFVWLAGWVVFVEDARRALPLGIFYLVLLINTYFSIRWFAGIVPPRKLFFAIDAVISLLYLGLALSMNSPLAFMILALSIFAVAEVKYFVALTGRSNVVALKRKIIIDALGVGLCGGGALGVILGYRQVTDVAVVAIFVAANFYLLVLRPMYRN